MATYASIPPEWLTLQSATTSELSKRNVDPKGTGGGQSSDGTQCPDSRNGGKSFNEGTSSNEGTSISGSRSRNGAFHSNKDSGSDDPSGTPDKLSRPQPRVRFANAEPFPGETQAQQKENPSLQRNGPQTSKGSDTHDAGTCKPCAFYCFSHGGCKNGTECEFCHLSHESRSRKKDMPAKAQKKPSKSAQGHVGGRKNGDSSERRRVVFGDSSVVSAKPSHEAAVLHDLQAQQLTAPPGIMAPVMDMADDLSSSPAPQVFSYTPGPVVVAVGQQVELWPVLTGAEPRVFAVAPELPRGLTIDKLSGVIHGTAQEATGMPIIYFVTCCEPRFNFNVSTAVVHVNILNNNALGYQYEAGVCASALHEDMNILASIAKVRAGYDYNSLDIPEDLCQGMARQSLRPPRSRQLEVGLDASSFQ